MDRRTVCLSRGDQGYILKWQEYGKGLLWGTGLDPPADAGDQVRSWWGTKILHPVQPRTSGPQPLSLHTGALSRKAPCEASRESLSAEMRTQYNQKKIVLKIQLSAARNQPV